MFKEISNLFSSILQKVSTAEKSRNYALKRQTLRVQMALRDLQGCFEPVSTKVK